MTDTYTPPPSWAAMYGDLDQDPNLFQDQPPTPGDRSSAAKHVARVRRDERAVAEARSLDRLVPAAEERREDEALERAIGLINRGGVPGTGTRLLAGRALDRRGGSGLSSAETMAARYLSRGRQQDQDQDDNDKRRRQGRRPRS
jgi:hypothetical protein